jgi:hypothetical protein
MAKATKAQLYKLLVQGIDCAHRWTMNQLAAKQNDVSLKRALRRNQVNDEGRKILSSPGSTASSHCFRGSMDLQG